MLALLPSNLPALKYPKMAPFGLPYLFNYASYACYILIQIKPQLNAYYIINS